MRSILLLALAFPSLFVRPAAACSFPSPTRIRTVSLNDGDTNVPTSVRVRVSYATGADAELQCGTKPPAPIIRVAAGDGGLGTDDGGAGPAGTWAIATDNDPHVATVWEFRPSVPLLPMTTYELVDTFPAMCPCGQNGCQPQAAAVFLTFTTGAAPDTTKPTFGGLAGTSCVHLTCAAGDNSCCGPYDHFEYDFVGAGNETDPDGHLVGVHLYVRPDGGSYDFTHPVGPLKLTDPDDSPVGTTWNITFMPGTYHVIARAFDSSGNEDDNMVETTFVFPLKDDPLCQGASYDMAMPDLYAIPDIATSDLVAGGDGGSSSGCSCAVGQRARGGTAGTAFALVLLVGLVGRSVRRRRGRRGSRRGGPGGIA